MSHLNNTSALVAKALSGEYRSPLHFGPDASPEFPKSEPLLMTGTRSPVKNPNAGGESLSDAIACVNGKC